MGSSVLIFLVPLFYLFDFLGVDPFPFLENNKDSFIQGASLLEKLLMPFFEFLVSIGIGSFG